MTLDTRIALTQPVPIKDLYAECARLLGPREDGREVVVSDTATNYGRPGTRTLANQPGQNLPGWLMIYYNADGPYRPMEDEWSEDEWEGQIERCYNGPACAIEVSIDTAYGYRENGASASDLHAWFVRELGKWLDARGIDWHWENEFLGEWYHRYDGLSEFGDAARGALPHLRSDADAIADRVLEALPRVETERERQNRLYREALEGSLEAALAKEGPYPWW